MPKLFLVPNAISETTKHLLPNCVAGEIKHVRVFFVEEPKSARRLLKSLDPQFPLNECRFLELSEHTSPSQIRELLQHVKTGDGAVISEAGCPCVADPGAELVRLAHQQEIGIIPLVGPSSILLALMASGLSGQNFAFNGYLPKDQQERAGKIKMLEDRSFKEKQTQIFMETPYRNQALLRDILETCQENTLLCLASGITGHTQSIETKPIKEWKKLKVNLDKKPALFLLQKT